MIDWLNWLGKFNITFKIIKMNLINKIRNNCKILFDPTNTPEDLLKNYRIIGYVESDDLPTFDEILTDRIEAVYDRKVSCVAFIGELHDVWIPNGFYHSKNIDNLESKLKELHKYMLNNTTMLNGDDELNEYTITCLKMCDYYNVH